MLGEVPNFELIDPLDYSDMAPLMAASVLLATDSGGLQEEGAALNVPVAVLRNVTDENPPTAEALALCVADLKRAIELHGACGGKKDLERAERLLKKQTAAEASAADKSDTSKEEGSAQKGSADSTAGEPGQASG